LSSKLDVVFHTRLFTFLAFARRRKAAVALRGRRFEFMRGSRELTDPGAHKRRANFDAGKIAAGERPGR
jgi:hypothetical protein